MLVEKIYYVANSKALDKAIWLLEKPQFCLSCDRELIEMNYSKVTIVCLDSQVQGVEYVLAPCV